MNTEDQAVTNLREYLRIKTVPPIYDYDGATQFLVRMAEEMGMSHRTVIVHPGQPVFIISWFGTDHDLPSIVLNSHMDVVPAYSEYWKYDPFEAHKDESGNIYARGAQDMKSIGMEYIEAVRKLKNSGKSFRRTIHLLFVPDEETDGHFGMELFIKTIEFKELNVGFVLDEGLASPNETIPVYYGERNVWAPHIICKGNPGHGSRFIQNTAAEKLRKVINCFLDFREKEEARLNGDPNLYLGDVTTCNLTKIEGGVMTCVVPAEMHAHFDMRIPTTVNLVEFENQLKNWCGEAGSDVILQFTEKWTSQTVTDITDSNPWWNAFKSACHQQKLDIKPQISSVCTDSRYLRALGIPAIGFSPLVNTPILLHDHNELINEEVYLKGIEHYTQIISALASVQKF